MPFIRIYGESGGSDFDTGANYVPENEFEYHAAEGNLYEGKLDPISQAVVEALRELGASQFRIRYDGGSDEGFAHADGAVVGGKVLAIERLLADLTTPENIQRFRAALIAQWKGKSAESLAKVTDQWVVATAVDNCAYTLASRLLGEGFGTGEYSLYGMMIADLQSGDISDDPDAEKPRNMD